MRKSLKIEISLDKSIKDLDLFFDRLKTKAVVTAARQAINKTVKATQRDSIRRIRQHRNLKIKDLKGSKGLGTRGFITTLKARSKQNLAQLDGVVRFSPVPLPLIFFIVGKKTPIVQKKANPQRKTRTFAITKGSKRPKKGLFVQKAKRGRLKNQVFRRADPSDKGGGFKMQSAPSVASFLKKRAGVLTAITQRASVVLKKEFDRALQNQLNKLR